MQLLSLQTNKERRVDYIIGGYMNFKLIKKQDVEGWFLAL